MRFSWVAAAMVIGVGCAHDTTAKKADRAAAESASAPREPQASVAADQPPVESARTTERQQDKRAEAPLTTEQPQERPVAPSPPVRGDTKERAMAQMLEFKNQMCACKDATCAQQVSDDMRKWVEEMNRSGEKPPPMTDADARQAKAIGQELGQCMQRASNK